MNLKDTQKLLISTEFAAVPEQTDYDITSVYNENNSYWYRQESQEFIQLEPSQYTIVNNGATQTLKILSSVVLNLAFAYQVLKPVEDISNIYNPVGNVDTDILKDRYNELTTAFKDLSNYVKSQLMIVDSNGVTKVLPKLKDGETWAYSETLDKYIGITNDATQIEVDLSVIESRVTTNENNIEVIEKTYSKNKDLYSEGYIIEGGDGQVNGSILNQFDITTPIRANLLQSSTGEIETKEVATDSFQTTTPNATYYLDLNGDGTPNWGTSHSGDVNYLPLWEINTDGSGNIIALTNDNDKRNFYPIKLNQKKHVLNFVNNALDISILSTIIKKGDVVEFLGYYAKGDAGNHHRVYSLSNDGTGIPCGTGFLNYLAENGNIDVRHFGAKSDGTDSSAAFSIANSINGSINVNTGTFTINTNLNLGDVKFSNGGKIHVNDTFTVNIESVNCEYSTQCFESDTDGVIRIKNAFYSLAWFEGDFANLKWDFLRRGLIENEEYVIHISPPKSTDPAFFLDGFWKLNGPLEFDGKENTGIVLCYASFKAVTSMQSMIHFSATEKTEQIYFPLGIELDGGYLAQYGMLISGGARLVFGNKVKCIRHDIGVCVKNDVKPTDELQFDFLEVTDFKQIGFLMDTEELAFQTYIKYFFTNGASNLELGTHIMVIKGNVRGFKCEKFTEAIASGVSDLTDVSSAIIYITDNAFGSPRVEPVIFDDITAFISDATVIKTSASIAQPVSFIARKIQTNSLSGSGTGKVLDISQATNSKIDWVSFDADDTIYVNSDCKNIDINCNPNMIRQPVLIDDLIVRGERYNRAEILDDGVLITTANTFNSSLIKITIDNTNAWALLLTQRSNLREIQKGSSVDLTTGALTGTTGLDGRVTISYFENKLYIENRLGASINIEVLGSHNAKL